MESPAPKVSIGLPVYNGERFLEEAIRSLLGQTYRDFELVICDNASGDRSPEICLDYANTDERIRFHRHQTNIGGFANHNRVFELSKGEYFTWAAHDDKRAPTHLERCVEVLEENEHLVLCYTMTRRIDAAGNQTEDPESPIELGYSDPSDRFRELIRLDYRLEPIYSLMRADAMRQTGLEGNYADSDRVFLAEMGLLGKFHRIPEPLFFRREHDERSVRVFASRQARNTWINPDKAGDLSFPFWRQWREYVVAVKRSPSSIRTKVRCLAHLWHWGLQNRTKLKSDLRFAVHHLISRVRNFRKATT